MTDHALLCCIPARGGSRGIPRKNLRLIGDEPLVARAVRHARQALGDEARIIVTTNDPQIAQVAELAGAEVFDRSDESETPDAPIWKPVDGVCKRLDWTGPVVIWQPSTVIGNDDDLRRLARSVHHMMDLPAPSIGAYSLTATRPHSGILWGGSQPLAERVNRQYQTAPLEAEVGIFATPTWPAPQASPAAPQIAARAVFVSLPSAVDIDTHHDLAEARAVASSPARVVFMAACGGGVGTGHVHRALVLADRLSDLDVSFMPMALDDWGRELVEQAGYPFTDVPAGAVICLDGPGMSADLVESMRYHGARAVVVFEDDGPAADAADLAVNELLAGPGLAGPRYATIRPEFMAARQVRIDGWSWRAERVLVTFGGSDPADMTANVAEWLGSFCEVETVTPPLEKGSPWEAPMARLLADSSLVVCSAGRTVYEAMCVGVPVISIPVNEREAMRPTIPGTVRLDEAIKLDDRQLVRVVSGLLADDDRRQLMADAGRGYVDGRGADRVAHAIRSLADDLL